MKTIEDCIQESRKWLVSQKREINAVYLYFEALSIMQHDRQEVEISKLIRTELAEKAGCSKVKDAFEYTPEECMEHNAKIIASLAKGSE